LNKINNALEGLSQKINRVRALQSATRDLSRELMIEKTVLDAALKSAQQSVELEESLAAKGPNYRAEYEKSYAELQAILSDPSTSDRTPMERHPLPNFESIGSHADPDIRLAIAAKVNELRKKRDAFLSKAHAQLASDPLLLASFEDPLRGLNGEHYWATLDPNSTLKRRA
jgi:argininosuccinate lyase